MSKILTITKKKVLCHLHINKNINNERKMLLNHFISPRSYETSRKLKHKVLLPLCIWRLNFHEPHESTLGVQIPKQSQVRNEQVLRRHNLPTQNWHHVISSSKSKNVISWLLENFISIFQVKKAKMKSYFYVIHVLWVELCLPENDMLELFPLPHPTVPQNVALFGDGLFAGVIKFKWGH